MDVCGPLDPEGSFDKDDVTKRVEGGVCKLWGLIKGRSEDRRKNERWLPAPVSNGTRGKSPHVRVRKSV